MTEKRRPDVLTLSRIFYALSVLPDLLSKAKMQQFGAAGSMGLIMFYK